MNELNHLKKFRSFISINLTPALHDSIEQFQISQENDVQGIRWTVPKNCHLTLKFLGDIRPDHVEAINSALINAAKDISAFQIELNGIGQFPPKGPASIVWVCVNQGNSTLLALENRIREELAEAEIEFDGKKFVPHLTIGRSKRNKRPFTKTLKNFESHHFGYLEVKEVYLMKSTLTEEGPIYESILAVPLAINAS